MTLYATLAQVKQYMNAESTIDDVKLLGLIRQVSNRIDRMFAPRRPTPFFAPYIQTRNNYLLDPHRVNSYQGTFEFGDPLMALTGVTVGSQALTVGSQVALWQGQFGVWNTLSLVEPACYSWYRYACGGAGYWRQTYVTIAGIWGYNVDYANAWIDTLQTIQNVGGITSSATSITVTDPEAVNALGLSPALSPGNLLQIDSEWLEVTAVDAALNTVTVRRGVNGSTAAAHNQGTAIYSFLVEEQITRAVYRQAALEYAKNGAYDNVTVTDLTTVNFTADVLAEFSALLTLFANI